MHTREETLSSQDMILVLFPAIVLNLPNLEGTGCRMMKIPRTISLLPADPVEKCSPTEPRTDMPVF